MKGVPHYLLLSVSMIILASVPLAGFGSQTISANVVGLRVVPIISLDHHRHFPSDNTQFNFLDATETADCTIWTLFLMGIAMIGLLPFPREFIFAPTTPPPR
ncbi:MAG: hypothetical protein GY943_33275 [Chloroflexi bacterium]|nr:hypothetical protein [Chloroflexota bacterium]